MCGAGVLALCLGAAFPHAQASSDRSDGEHKRAEFFKRSPNTIPALGSTDGRLGALRVVTSTKSPACLAVFIAAVPERLCCQSFVREIDFLAALTDVSRIHPARAPPFQRV
jgi:hypothetical protein